MPSGSSSREYITWHSRPPATEFCSTTARVQEETMRELTGFSGSFRRTRESVVLTMQLLDDLLIQRTLPQQFGRSAEGLSSAGEQEVKMLSQQQSTAIILGNMKSNHMNLEFNVKMVRG